MVTRTLIVFFILVCAVRAVEAHPPRDMTLTYDKEKGTLHISLSHISKNPRDHFIRKIIVYKNNEELEEHYFVTQTSGKGLETDISIEAGAGDVIGIKAICNKAGYAEAKLTIEENNETEK